MDSPLYEAISSRPVLPIAENHDLGDAAPVTFRTPTSTSRRAGLTRGTCHELRHTCLTRLREAGMSLEAIQAQAGQRSIESTRIYLHLADGWLAAQYREAQEAIDAQAQVGGPR